jgi:TetR/AcrR family transcriptional regulator, fatty acid metabolism regulator protein
MKRYLITAKGKLNKRSQQAQETKQRIFDVASELIIIKGLDNVTLEEISRKAGVSKGLFYHYFKSKSDLIVETYKIIDTDFDKELMDLDVKTSQMDRVLFTVNFMARRANEAGMDYTKQIYKGQLDTVPGLWTSKTRPFFKTMHDSIAALQEQGILDTKIRADEYAHFMMAIARGVLYDWCLNNGEYDVEAAMDRCFRKIVFRGLEFNKRQA